MPRKWKWLSHSILGCRERYQCCKIALSSRVAGCRSRYAHEAHKHELVKIVGNGRWSLPDYMQSIGYALPPLCRYDCCNLRANSKGCRKVCKKCDKAWGTSAPGCFEKPHNVIELTSKEAEIEDGRMPHKDQPYQKII